MIFSPSFSLLFTRKPFKSRNFLKKFPSNSKSPLFPHSLQNFKTIQWKFQTLHSDFWFFLPLLYIFINQTPNSHHVYLRSPSIFHPNFFPTFRLQPSPWSPAGVHFRWPPPTPTPLDQNLLIALPVKYMSSSALCLLEKPRRSSAGSNPRATVASKEICIPRVNPTVILTICKQIKLPFRLIMDWICVWFVIWWAGTWWWSSQVKTQDTP